jgi:Mg-chelatase subunit ChlD
MDPLALLLEVSVGGGTHIAKGLRYARSLITVPQRSIVIVVSDFEEGYSIDGLLGEVRALVEAGVTCLGLAALDDRGAPRYAVPIAEQVAGAGMPVAALTPMELARWIGAQIR